MTPDAIRHIALILATFFGSVTLVLLLTPYVMPAARQQRRALATRLEEIRRSRDDLGVLRVESREAELPEGLVKLLGARLSKALLQLHQRADAHGNPMNVLLQAAGAMLAGGAIGALLAGMVTGALAGLLAGSLPLLRLTMQARRRQQQFARQFGPVLEFLARSMRSGLDLPGAMRMVCEEFPEPAANEFRRAVDEINFGMAIDATIARMEQRVGCSDLAYLGACVSIQRETGGGLAQSLNTLARSIRERRMFDAKVRTLSAQGRLSAAILCILPLAVLAIMMVTNRSYIGVLLDTPSGNQILFGALALTATGVLWIAMLMRVRI